MRNPNRIPKILKELEDFWMAYPDLRLGQIIENVKPLTKYKDSDTFFMEDDEFLRGLEELRKL